MKVYLDDERPTPTDWVGVRWPDEAIRLLETGQVTELSLDHDLGDDTRGTGYTVILWLEEAVALRGFVQPEITIHTANASARQKMLLGVQSIHRLAQQQPRRNPGS
ncbi:MAG: cyclic-phosphate processing receiver domain-containing protein [Fimbriiglobus sp.]